MSSVSFDPVAHAYDATRGYPPAIAQQIVQAIVATARANEQTRFLEVGIGTGRIAFPLACLGHDYTGVDISEKMVERLEAKLRGSGWQEQDQFWGTFADEDRASSPLVRRFTRAEKRASLRLVMGDMTALPFYAASFDVAIAVHVFHLVDGWQKAVSEVLRVVRPGGLFLHCWDEHNVPDEYNIGKVWEQILHELGGEDRRPGTLSADVDVAHWLQEQGLQPEEMHVVRWETTDTMRQAIENFSKRLWSGSWMVPDDLFAESVKRLDQWAHERFGDNLDAVERIKTHEFVISRTRVG